MTSILFLEGEHGVRTVFSECLRNDGYAVIEAGDMAEAARACRQYDAPIDLSIMEAEDGIVAEARRMTEKYPAMKVLFIGGPQWRPRIEHRLTKSAWLERPFTYQALAESVRSLTGEEV